MSILITIYQSSVGKKILMAVTGACLCIYLIVHLAGNLLLFRQDGGAAFNAYAAILPSLLIIRVIEIILFAIFIGHIFLGTLLWWKNRSARPQGYRVNKAGENSTTLSRIMFYTGGIVFIFLVVHLTQFWAPSRFASVEPKMYDLVLQAFHDPFYAILYIVAMALLAFHLQHGFQSALQAFGLRNARYLPLINLVGALFWLAIPLGFALMPLYFLLNL